MGLFVLALKMIPMAVLVFRLLEKSSLQSLYTSPATWLTQEQPEVTGVIHPVN